MIQISQNDLTRRWGFRIYEGDPTTGFSRQLYEDFNYDSPNTVYAVISDVTTALQNNRVRNTKDGVVHGYTVWGQSNDIIMTEGGWTTQDDVNSHVNKIKSNLLPVRMMMLPKPKAMSIGGSGSNNALTSSYTDPNTGETKVFGENIQSAQELANRARRMEQEEGMVKGSGWE